MKRTFLTGLGLDDDIISKIMDENGRDIEREKAVAKSLKEDHDNLKLKMSDMETELKTALNAESSDIGSLKKSVDDWKAKAEAAQAEIEKAKTEADAKISGWEFDRDLDAALKAAKVKDPKIVLPLLNREGLKRTDKGIEGLDEQLKPFTESHGYLFDVEQAAQESTAQQLPVGVSIFQPDGSKGASTTYTTEQIKSMSPQQINANWDSIKNTLKKG